MHKKTAHSTKSPKPERPERVGAEDDVKIKLLKKWQHACAICGNHRIEWHHVNGCSWDGYRDENFLPLCPNCHQGDVERNLGLTPDQSLDLPERLCLLQRTQNPYVLDYRFLPLWKRIQFLRDLAPSGTADGRRHCEARKEKDHKKWSAWLVMESVRLMPIANEKRTQARANYSFCVRDLLCHVSTFQRGDYYAARMRSALVFTKSNWKRLAEHEQAKDATMNDTKSIAGQRRRMVENLAAELLLFQGWPRPSSLHTPAS